MSTQQKERFRALRRMARRRAIARAVLTATGYLSVVALVAGSAIWTRERGGILPLARVEFVTTGPTASSALVADELGGGPEFVSSKTVSVEVTGSSPEAPSGIAFPTAAELLGELNIADPSELDANDDSDGDRWLEFADDPTVRWFNGRPIRPARDVTMVVTGYSPDEKSCGDSADGITATLHSVYTNGFALAAADPQVLPYGSLISVPGYDQGRVVPVLDCGSAIKGRRLDVLFPTDRMAMRWGKQRLTVTVWSYADGHPASNPRRLR